jgi:hypothetical protein
MVTKQVLLACHQVACFASVRWQTTMLLTQPLLAPYCTETMPVVKQYMVVSPGTSKQLMCWLMCNPQLGHSRSYCLSAKS